MRRKLLLISSMLLFSLTLPYALPTAEIKQSIPAGDLQIHHLSVQWICVVGDYSDFLIDQVSRVYGKQLSKLDKKVDSIPRWSYEEQYTEAIEKIVGEYRPLIQSKFSDGRSFTISGEMGDIAIDRSSYWIEGIAQMIFPYLNQVGLHDAQMAKTAHYAYLHLAEPMVDGKFYTITTAFDEEVSFSYQEKDILSYAVKVNQEGYVPDAGEKYGYLGLWAGTDGAISFERIVGSPFYLIDEETEEKVFSGSVSLRSEPQYHHTKDGLEIPIDGEYVYELDFSSFVIPGDYHLYIPKIGRSWSFSIGYDAIGYAFYTHTRGLYHQRSGIAKGEPLTEWDMGAGHRDTYQGGFAPNDTHYRAAKESYGFFDSSGEPVTYHPFTMVADTATDQLLPDVWGGWYDAGDFDRRMYHFSIVEDLLTAYLMYPNKFRDNQLDIPESGNNIPDIIDEAAWGIDVWLRAQQDDGGVGCWIEAESHPQIYDPALDTQRYYLSLATRESSLSYASSAALLALAYREAGEQMMADRYATSAKKAFTYAMDPSHTVDVIFTHKEGLKKEQYQYKEPAVLDSFEVFHAASLLSLLTDSEEYTSYLTDDGFSDAMQWFYSSDRAYHYMYLSLFSDQFKKEWVQTYTDKVLYYAGKLLESQQELAYRTVNWSIDHGYFQFMAWGRGLPYYKGRAILAAWYITGEKTYYDSALLLVDWMSGANSQGRSLTTGIGEVSPVKVLSLPAIADGIEEPFPGITPFTYTGGISYQAKKQVYMLSTDKDEYTVLLPGLIGEDTSDDIYEELSDKLETLIPIYRRHTTIEHLIVDQNEFTVWETIAPAASFTACLIPEGWMPAESWKDRLPIESLQDLPGYIPQP